MPPLPPRRSVLFAPADRPDLIAKLPRVGADAVILDLEDAVVPARKAEARQVLSAVTEEVWVRLNPVGSEWFAEDVRALPRSASAVALPKAESAAHMDRARESLPAGVAIVAGIETATGVLHAEEVCRAADGVYFGAEDLAASTGGRRRPDNLEVLAPRTWVALAAASAGIPALDQVVADVHDHDRLREEAAFARDLGYSGKICIHPGQVPVVHEVFTPTAEEVEAARRIVDAAAEAAADGRGVVVVDGRMVDSPVIAQARRVLFIAGGGR